MDGELLPAGHHRRKADPRYAQKLKEGGKKADIIRQLTEKQHKKLEEPTAERELEKDLTIFKDQNA